MSNIEDLKGFIDFPSGFKLLGQVPMDARYAGEDESFLDSIVSIDAAYPGLRVFIKSDNQFYVYKKDPEGNYSFQLDNEANEALSKVLDLEKKVSNRASDSNKLISTEEVQEMLDQFTPDSPTPSISREEVEVIVEGEISKLSEVSKTGSYNDLKDQPTIPSKLSELEDDKNFATEEYVTETIRDIAGDDSGATAIADLKAHKEDKNNPHSVTKAQIGLGNVDNTSDADKPVSTLQQEAIDNALEEAKSYADEKISSDGSVEEHNTSSEAHQDIRNSISDVQSSIENKVDKVEGKSLLEDSEIERLATLENYDDTDLRTELSSKANSEDVQTALNGKVDKELGKSLISTTDIDKINNNTSRLDNILDDNEGILKQAKDYSDKVILYNDSTPTTIDLGGIPKNTNLSGKSVIEILKSLLLKYVAPSISSFSTSPDNGGITTPYEIGKKLTISSASVRITPGSEPVTKITIYKGSEELGSKESGISTSNSITLTNSLEISSDTTLTAKATDGKNTATKDLSYYFYNGVYFGVGTVTEASQVTDSFIQGLTKRIQGTKLSEFEATAGEGQYIYYAQPVSYGTPAFFVGGFETALILVSGNFDYTNSEGYSTKYNLWRTANANLGKTAVTLK